MNNVHNLKGQKALDAFTQATYDLENLEPEISGMLVIGRANQRKAILTKIKDIQRVLIKLEIAVGGCHRGR